MNRNAFRPGPLEGLDVRLALSTIAARVPAEVLVRLPSAGGAAHALSAPGANRDSARFEVRWMRGMISHHGMAIAMAKVALRNSANPEVISLARGIIRAQTKEISQMRSWLADWYGVRGARPMMTADDRSMIRELRRQTGAAFDRAFLSMMIEHHADAVRDGSDCLANATHPRLRRLCANIETTQTEEIGRMQQLLAESGGTAEGGGLHAM